MRSEITLASMMATAVLALTLTGCTVDVVGNGSEAPAGSSSTSEDRAPGSDIDIELSRDDLIAAATRTMRCDDELTLLDDAMATRVEGGCGVLVLNTTGSMIVADDVDTLKIIGDDNVVYAGAVDTLLVNGEGNVVIWTGDTPAVTDVGSTNVLKAE